MSVQGKHKEKGQDVCNFMTIIPKESRAVGSSHIQSRIHSSQI